VSNLRSKIEVVLPNLGRIVENPALLTEVNLTRSGDGIYPCPDFIFQHVLHRLQISFDLQIELLTFAILAFGAVAYVRSSKITQRAQSLLVGFGIAWILIVSVNSVYWNGQQEVWMREPAHWQTTLLQLLVPGMILLGLLFSPIILSGLQRFSRSTKPA
jgi:hypothetical protein